MITIPLRRHIMISREITEKVQTAINQGKIRPDQKQWAIDYAKRDPEGFEVFVAKAPGIPVMQETPARDADEIDETQRMINALFGIDDETFRKYHGSIEHVPTTGIDETQRAINRMCGVDDETYRKFGKR